ncbi:hypothetical protein D4764_07G0001000 [Takifugu flavidus]|uniref:Alkylated DNA repair protein AlkB homologue 8 N-terminal domain-containing protein n=1 Tax=Takifugu flavidus TaxID=433684 RepID=A0A5C6MTB9_9TELE|nr:hypothetical protein D4764_07G0001000 [Takifugu flavidus]
MEANAAASSTGITSPDKRLEGSIATAREESNTSLTRAWKETTPVDSWRPEVLELQQLQGKITVERAHRLGPRRQHKTDYAPRTRIMKFLNYKDKEAVMKAARAKKQVHYKNHPVRLYHDVTAETHKKQKEFEEARRQLCTLGLQDDEEEEHQCLVRDFVAWCHNNSLQLNTSKTKELVIDFERDRPRPRPVQIGMEEVEGVQTYKYLGLWLDNRLDWTSNTRQLYKKTQSRMYFLRRLRSFNICRKLLWMFYQSVVTSILSYLAERRTIDKLRSIMDNVRHPLHTVIHSQRSLISQRLRLPKFRTNRLGNSFIP